MSKTHSIANWAMSYGGIPLSGFGPDTSVVVTHEGERASMSIGADGEGTFNLMKNRSAKVAVTLMQTSNSNTILEAFMVAQDAEIPIAGDPKPLLFTDLNTKTSYLCSASLIEGPPDETVGPEVGTREWMFLCPQLIAVPLGQLLDS